MRHYTKVKSLTHKKKMNNLSNLRNLGELGVPQPQLVKYGALVSGPEPQTVLPLPFPPVLNN